MRMWLRLNDSLCFLCDWSQPGCVNTTEADIKKSSRMKQPHKTRKVNLTIRCAISHTTMNSRGNESKALRSGELLRTLFETLEGLFEWMNELIDYLCFVVFSQFMVYRMTSAVTVPHTPAHPRLKSPLRKSYRNRYTQTHTAIRAGGWLVTHAHKIRRVLWHLWTNCQQKQEDETGQRRKHDSTKIPELPGCCVEHKVKQNAMVC